MVTIDGKQYPVQAMTAQQYAILCADAKIMAQKEDRPLERFLKKLVGVTGADRETAITAYMQRPDWDDPPQHLSNKAMVSPWIKLLAVSFWIRVSVMELREVLRMPELDAVYGHCMQEVATPELSILERNAILKERIAASHKKLPEEDDDADGTAGSPSEPPPTQPQPELQEAAV